MRDAIAFLEGQILRKEIAIAQIMDRDRDATPTPAAAADAPTAADLPRVCICGCGERVNDGRRHYATALCRLRAGAQLNGSGRHKV